MKNKTKKWRKRAKNLKKVVAELERALEVFVDCSKIWTKTVGCEDPFVVTEWLTLTKLPGHERGLFEVARRLQQGDVKYDEYSPRLEGEARIAAQQDPTKPEGACCNNERRGWNGGCENCGDPCL